MSVNWCRLRATERNDDRRRLELGPRGSARDFTTFYVQLTNCLLILAVFTGDVGERHHFRSGRRPGFCVGGRGAAATWVVVDYGVTGSLSAAISVNTGSPTAVPRVAYTLTCLV